MDKGDRVVTYLGTGICTGNFDSWPGQSWTRAEVKLDEIPEHYKTNTLWFYRKDFVPPINK